MVYWRGSGRARFFLDSFSSFLARIKALTWCPVAIVPISTDAPMFLAYSLWLVGCGRDHLVSAHRESST
jgi:hypothetical protein